MGQVQQHRRRVFQEFRRAEYEIARYDETVWSLRKTEILVAMALLLSPFLFYDQAQEGNESCCAYVVELMKDRLWLSEIWLKHNRNEVVSFGRCRYCPCRSLARVQRLWESEMTQEDYISFLSVNSWIWSIEPGWAMEKQLRENLDSMELACMSCLSVPVS